MQRQRHTTTRSCHYRLWWRRWAYEGRRGEQVVCPVRCEGESDRRGGGQGLSKRAAYLPTTSHVKSLFSIFFIFRSRPRRTALLPGKGVRDLWAAFFVLHTRTYIYARECEIQESLSGRGIYVFFLFFIYIRPLNYRDFKSIYNHLKCFTKQMWTYAFICITKKYKLYILYTYIEKEKQYHINYEKYWVFKYLHRSVVTIFIQRLNNFAALLQIVYLFKLFYNVK